MIAASVRSLPAAFRINFYISFLAVFLAALFALGFAATRIYDARTKAISNATFIPGKLNARLHPIFPAGSVRAEIERAEDAKRQGLFWAKLGGVAQAAIDYRQHPGLIAQLYPGYPAALAEDTALWKDYFAHDFHTSIWLPTPAPVPFEGISVYTAPFGCVDIFRRYGADVVILGNSETMTSLIPQILHERLGGKDKVLMCALPGSLPRSNQLTAEALGTTGKRARWAVWGYSFWSAYTASPQADEWNRMHENMHRDLAAGSSAVGRARAVWRFIKSARVAQLFPPLTWEDFFKPSLAGIRAIRANAEKEAMEAKGDIATRDIYRSDIIAATVARASEAPVFLRDITEKDCDLGKARAEFTAALAAMLAVADRALVYIPPVTPHLSTFGPPCYLKNVREMVRAAAADPRVVVVAEEWDKFGLNYGDFLYLTGKVEPNATDFFYRADAAHMNYEGGRKVTERIAARLKSGKGD